MPQDQLFQPFIKKRVVTINNGPAAENLKALVEKIIWRREKGPQVKVPYRQR